MMSLHFYILRYKDERLEDIKHQDVHQLHYWRVEQCISENECRRFEQGLNTQVKSNIEVFTDRF